MPWFLGPNRLGNGYHCAGSTTHNTESWRTEVTRAGMPAPQLQSWASSLTTAMAELTVLLMLGWAATFPDPLV